MRSRKRRGNRRGNELNTQSEQFNFILLKSVCVCLLWSQEWIHFFNRNLDILHNSHFRLSLHFFISWDRGEGELADDSCYRKLTFNNLHIPLNDQSEIWCSLQRVLFCSRSQYAHLLGLFLIRKCHMLLSSFGQVKMCMVKWKGMNIYV